MLAAGAAVGLPASFGDSTSNETTTPIKHVVVIFDENVTFDHYFGTYPHALNPPGEPPFTPRPGTPPVNGLTNTLLTDNPNEDNPERLDRAQAVTCDQNHNYTNEQLAYDDGLVDHFVQHTAGAGCTGSSTGQDPATVMDYYDGNTVTALWNYAQYYTLEDNSYGTQYGPSSPGAINLISGETGGASATKTNSSVENGSLIGNANPLYDDCSPTEVSRPGGVPEPAALVSMSGRNVGDLLNEKGLTWGWFQGGFTPVSRTSTGAAVCGSSHNNVSGASAGPDYVTYHEPFQYYASTANPHHLPPISVSTVGQSDQANHQYDLSYFTAALQNGNLPAVSFLKAPAYEDGHPHYSDPLDEQRFLVETINTIEESSAWSSTAIVISWDDSDGWYDHVMPPLVRPSASPPDRLTGLGKCGTLPNPLPPNFQNDRCGYGPRIPMLVISPWARENYVDDTLTDQSSIMRFIEDNWQLGRIGGDSSDAEAGSLEDAFDFESSHTPAPKIILDPTTGELVSPSPGNTQGTSASSPGANVPTSPSKSPTLSSPYAIEPVPFTCSLRRRKHKHKMVTVTCQFRTLHFRGRTAVRFRIVRRGKVLCTARSLLHDSRATATLHAHRALEGQYVLRIALTNKSGVVGFSRTVRIA